MTVLSKILNKKGEAVTRPPLPGDVNNSSYRKIVGAKGTHDPAHEFANTRKPVEPIQIPWKKIFKWTGIAIATPIVIIVSSIFWDKFSVSVVTDNMREQIVRVNSVYEESVEIAKSRNATEAELQSLNYLAEDFDFDVGLHDGERRKRGMDWDLPEKRGDQKIIDLQNKLATIPTIEERAEAKIKEEAEAKIKAEVEAKALAKAKAKAQADADAKAKSKAKAEAKLAAEKKNRMEAEAKAKAKKTADNKAWEAKKDYDRSAFAFEKQLKRFDGEVSRYNKVAEGFKPFNVKVPAAPKAPAVNLDGVKTSGEIDALVRQVRTLELKVNGDRQNLDQQLQRAKKAEKKKKDKLSKIIKEYTKAYTAYSALHKQLHSAMSNANKIAKLKPYISKISSPLIAKDNIKKVKTYNEGLVVYNKIYNAYKMLKNDKNVWQKTIKQYNSGRL
jgi:DNA repair exonuclease SbcCD ATPase subunit